MKMLTSEFFWDNSIRLDTVIWLSAEMANQSSSLKDFLSDNSVEEIGKIINIPDLEQSDLNPDNFMALTFNKGLVGFLINASTPVPREFFKTGWSYSWGRCYTQWFYTKSLDARFGSQLKAWRREIIKEAKSKAKLVNAQEIVPTE